MQTSLYHTPVLLQDVVSFLVTTRSGVYVDATVGGGGHARAILETLDGVGRLVGLDADDDAIAAASANLATFGGSALLRKSNFQNMRHVLTQAGVEKVAGVLFDLGVSSFQLDEPSRGFSFRGNDRLDMRMDRSQPLDAFHVVNDYDEKRLADLFWKYGEERNSRRIAKAVARKRAKGAITSTADLATIVGETTGERFLTKTLARIFQAIRIEVNNELDILKGALTEAIDVLHEGGRLVVVSYHSLEDRITKETMKAGSARVIPSGHKLLPDILLSPTIKILTKKPVLATDRESSQNPRSRSAKLRAAEKI